MVAFARWAVVTGMLASALACGSTGETVTNQQITVGCGMCRFGIVNTERPGCYWAAEFGDKHVPVFGPLPHDHENHSPTGMCNMNRRAIVDGTLKEDRFVATRFELLPASAPPSDPAFTPDDEH